MALAETIGKQLQGAERCSDRRQELFDRYMNEPRGDEVEGRSSVLTSEIFDVVESVTAEIMDLVAGEQRVASFPPMSAEDEESAEQETDACNAVFWEESNGFQLLQTVCRAGLIEQNGYSYRGWVSEDVVSIQEHGGMTLEEALNVHLAYANDPDVESVEVLEMEGIEEVQVPVDPADPDGETVETYIPTGEEISVKVRCTKSVDTYEIKPIPKANILMTPRWSEVSLKNVPFVAIEHIDMTRGDLLAMGFSEDSVEALYEETDDGETDNRHSTKSNEDDGTEDPDTVTVYECYIIDDEGDLPVCKRAWMASDQKTPMEWKEGGEAIDEVDGVPIDSWTPIPVPFRHNGRALAEVVEDLEAVNTVLLRQSLDSIYATNYPRDVVNEDQVTPSTYADIALPDHGAPIRVRGDARSALAPKPTQSIAGATLPMMQRVDAAKEERTGVTKLSQGLDENTLNKTARGQQMLLTQGQKRLKLIVRNFGEYIREMFVGIHADLRKGNRRDLAYMTGGAWNAANPVEWPERRSMRVSIGTGNGDNQQKQMTLQMMAGYQRELMGAGSLMVDEAKAFETLDRMARLGGYGGAGTFFNDPRSEKYQQAQQARAAQPKEPDPATILAQAEAEKARAQASKAEADAMLKYAEIEANEREAERKHLERMTELQIKAAEADTKDTKVAADINAAAEKQDLEEQKHADDVTFKYDKLAVEVAQ